MQRPPLRLVTWNINGLRSFIARKRREHGWNRERLSDVQVLFECFVKELKLQPDSSPPDVVCLQELKVQAEDVSERFAKLEHPAYPFYFEGYFSFCFRGSHSKTIGYSGVAIYVRQERDLVQTRPQTWQVWRGEEGITGELPVRCLAWPSVPRCARLILENSKGQCPARKQNSIPSWRTIAELSVGGYPIEWQQTDVEHLESAQQRRQLDEEGRALLLDLSGLIIVHVYVPNAANEERLSFKQQFLACLEARCRHWITVEKRLVVILGDLNTAHERIDHCNPEEAEREAAKLYPSLTHAVTETDPMTNEAVMMGSLPAWVSFNSPSVERAPMISASYDESEPHSIIQRSSVLSDCSNTAEAAVRKRITFEEHPSRGWLHRMLGGDLFRDLFREHWPDRRDAYSCWNTQTQARMTNYGTRIDYILMSRNADTYLQSSACDLLPKVMGSDHCPCMVELVPLVDTEHWPWHCSRPCVPLRYRYRFREKQTSLRRLWQAASIQRDGAVLDPSQGDMHPGESSFLSAGNERPARNREAKASEFALEHRERCRKSDLSVSMPVLHTRCVVEDTDPCRRDGISVGANTAPITRQGDRKRHETDHTARLCRAEQRPVRPERSKPDCSNGCELISTSAVSRAGRGTKRTSLLAWQSGTDLTASAVTSHQKSPESEVTGGTRSTTTGMAGAVGPSPLEPGPYQVKQRSIAALSREMFRGTRSQIQGMVVAAGNAPSSTLPSGCTSTDIAGSAEAEGTCSYVQTSNANHVHGAEAQTIARASSPSLQTRETSKTLHGSVHRTSDASVAGSLPDTQATLEQRPYQVDSRSDAVSESKSPAETMVIRTHAARSPNRNNTHSTRVQRSRMNLACERAPQATLERFLQKPQESVALTEEEETTLTEAARAAQPTPKPSDEFGKGAQASLQRTDMEGWQALLSITCGRAGQRELPRCYGHGEPAVLRTVRQGPHRGRQFYVCRRPAGPVHRGGRCNFFQWKTESLLKRAKVEATTATTTGHRRSTRTPSPEV